MSALTVKRVDRLIGASVLGSVLTVWLVLTGMDAVLQLLRQIGNVGKHGYAMRDALMYVLVTFPRRGYEMFGYAALIGALLALGSLAGSGELTALRAAGMSRLRIAGSATGVIAVLIAAVVLLGETAAPWGDQVAQSMQLRMRSGTLGIGTRSGLWTRDADNFINARGALLLQRDGVSRVQLADVRQFSFADDGRLQRFTQGQTAESDGTQWVLHGVRTTTLDAQGVHSSTAATQPWPVRIDARVLAQSLVQPQYLSMRDLRRNIGYLRNNGEQPGSYALAFWTRVMYPFNVLVLVLCSMPFAFGALRSGGLGKRIFVGMLLAIAWYFVQPALVNAGTVYGLSAMWASLLPAVLLVVLAVAYFRRRTG
ncbi:MAG: LPS export ABC transporter permease LptG [Xanthomonadales bacterium]|nr:LPS export ABC transporter permease LptG [Xanthomonadales bacterium]